MHELITDELVLINLLAVLIAERKENAKKLSLMEDIVDAQLAELPIISKWDSDEPIDIKTHLAIKKTYEFRGIKSRKIKKDLHVLKRVVDNLDYKIQEANIALQFVKNRDKFKILSVGYIVLIGGTVVSVANIDAIKHAVVYRYMFNRTRFPISTRLDSPCDRIKKGIYGYSAEKTVSYQPSLVEFIEFKKDCFEKAKTYFNADQRTPKEIEEFNKIAVAEIDVLSSLTEDEYTEILADLISDLVLVKDTFKLYDSYIGGFLESYQPFNKYTLKK